jgi:membrane-bound lytic murein transglycosylase D
MAAVTRAAASVPEPAVLPAHIHAAGVSIDLDIHAFETQERVARYIKVFSGSARESFGEQLERGTRYEGMIRTRLRAAGLPEDMYYLALIESGFDPHAVSRSNAVGMWQFMAPTARDVGLRVDWWADERRDPIRATDAAARTMKWLRSQFGSMLLAAAAYNGGEGRVSRALVQLARVDSLRADSIRIATLLGEEDDTTGVTFGEVARVTAPAAEDSDHAVALGDGRFFALASTDYLRAETKNYVPQLIAALLVAKEAPRYGIVVHPQAAFAYDSVRVGPLVPLAAVAEAAHATREQLLDLNPHLLRGVTPPGAASLVRVPVGAGEATAGRLDDASPAELRVFRRVTTKKRETLAAIAEREGVSTRLLARYNPSLETVRTGKWKGRLVSAQAVRVPTRAVLAFARDVPDFDGAALSGLPMPAAPRAEPADAPNASKTSAAKKSAAKKSAAKKSTTKATSTKSVTKSPTTKSAVAAKPASKSKRPDAPNGSAKAKATTQGKANAANGKSAAKPNASKSATKKKSRSPA